MQKTLLLQLSGNYSILLRRFSFFMVGLLMAASAMATNYPVTTLANTGAGSLRQAILNANGDPAAPHTITFTVSGVINITSSLPAITRPVTIDGNNTITISGPGGDNFIELIVLGAGSGGSTIRNLTLRNTGLEPIRLAAALSGVTLYNLKLTQTGTHYANHGVLANGAVTNLTIRKVEITGLQDNFYGLKFNSTVTNLMIDSFSILGGGGGTARGITIQGVSNGVTIKNSFIDMDDPATSDDGDYCVFFASTGSNINIDSTIFRDGEIYPLYFTGNSTLTNCSLKNSTFDNQHGGPGVQAVRFETTTSVNTLTIDKNLFKADMLNTADDANYGLVLGSLNNQNIFITNNIFTDYDGAGLHVAANHAANTDNLTIKGNTFARNGSGTDAQGGMRIFVRNATSDAGPVLITENIFGSNNGVAIGVYPGNDVASTVANFTISKNTIYNTQSTLGAIYVRAVNKVVITENSIYNNVGKGIELVTNANCAYEGANTPQLLSSTETTPGTYTLSVKMPAICGAGNCSLEIFSSKAGVTGVGGQHYVTTRTGLAAGTNSLTGITGIFPEINTAPYGTWTATLKLNNNCGTSEFSNKIRVKIVGPAGVTNGVKLWLRGDEILVNGAAPTADGQVINGWEELSGGGAPSAVTYVNDPRTKLSGINFHPVADLDGDLIRGVFPGGPSWITSNAITTVGVFNPQSISANADRIFVLYSQSGVDYNTNGAQIEWYRSGDLLYAYRGNNALAPGIPGLVGIKAFNRPGVFSSVTSPTNHTGYYNGANIGGAAYNKGNYAISQWFVGGGYGPNPNGNGTYTWYYMSEVDFGEVVTFNRNLDPGELQRVQSYMGLKYGIAMKQNYVFSNGSLVWDVTANAAYSKEIAALALDNVSILHQKQARAFQPDEVVTIGLGSALAATNRDNEGEITNDLSVLMWGNDSASTVFSQAFTAGAFANTRMPRRWKVQKTNWADQEITVKLTGGKTGLYLLISTDPNFATISQELPLNNDGTVTLSSSLLANGAYFTFGREQKKPGGVMNGLQVWVKADEGVTMTGINATSWEDQGPAMRVWPKINTVAINWNSAAINYNPSLNFPSGSYFYYPSFTNTYTQGEVFSVQSSPSMTPSFPWQLGGNSAATAVYYRFTDNNMYLHFGTNARRNFLYGTKNLALPAILNVNTAANSWTASLDGRAYSGPVAAPSVFTQASGLVNNYIGAGHASTFTGQLPETILYNRKLTATERQQVNSYMALKYGITLDQTAATDYLASDGTTTMWKASDNGIFKTNIAGIGLDENGTLLQKQSRSINTAASGNLISVAVGSELAPSNAENTDTIKNDKSFLVWADNNGAITYATNVTAEKATFRMARVWKADKTNWADRNITIKLHTGVANAYLLISNSDATFATIDQELPINADSTITIGSDLLPDGAYFTFAKEIKGPGYVNAGVQLWLRADDIISSGNRWNDYSGNDVDAVQATVPNQPLLTSSAVNFNPAFRFDGTDDYMDIASTLGLTGTNAFTVVGLGIRETVGDWDAFLSQQGTATNGFLFGISSTNLSQLYSTGVGTSLGGTTPLIKLNYPYLITGTRTGNNFALYNTGVPDGAGTSTHSYAISNMRLGNRLTTADLAFKGYIPEVIVYNRILPAGDLQQVHSYLSLKYGLTLNNGATDYLATDGTTKIWSVAKNPGYNKNIAGIGRDDKTALYQKQSRSVNDTMITVAAGTGIAADNLSNTADIDNLSFFTWADNGGAATFSVPVSSVANATTRMARVWKVDRTNWTDQDITIKAVPGGERYLLIHATDPAFGAGTVEYAIATATGLVTINTADIPDGAYFTLGTKIVGPACVNNGIATWLRADYGATAANWVDFSGNQVTAAQATVANQPALLANGLNYNPALQFNGTTDYLQIPQASITGKFAFGNTARTLIGVGFTATTTDQLLFSYGTFVTNQASGLRTNGTRAVFEGSGAANGVTGPLNSVLTNRSTIISGRYVGGANGTAYLYTNDTSSIASLPMSWNTLISAEGAQVGKYIGENRWWNGNIGEVIVYNRNLTDAEFHRVSSYLAIKYGITLDQSPVTDYIASDGTTKMWTAADNTGYNRRITGIGRDDCTELYQKQSLSVDTGIVAIAIGEAIAASNQANANTIDNPNSYFVFADNGGATQYSTIITGLSNLTARMPRVWKVDKTNWTDADISFKLTGGNDKIYLVASADETFDGADAAYQLATDGTVTVPSSILADGGYFTFAKAVNGPGYVNIGVQFWLRADDDVSTADTWYDYSGNDNDATQPTAVNQPVPVTGIVNYNPAYLFDGTNDYMNFNTNAGISGTNQFTVVNVAVRNTASTIDAIIAQQGVVTNNALVQYSLTNKYGISSTNVSSVLTTGSTLANIPYLSATTRGPANLFSLYTNGAADGTGTQAYTFNTTNLRLGNRDVTGDAAFPGHINEVVVYNKLLTSDELQQVHSYMALKYGITMTGDYKATDGTTIYWNTVTNAGYLNNITGIGRDDKTVLNQKQSRSVNTAANGNMIAMGLSSIAATNKDNTATFDDDLSYLVWGDNGATATKTSEYPLSLNPTGCSNVTRLQREWKVQKTGTVNDVQLLMYLAGQVPTSTSAGDLKLLIDDDGDFGNGGTAIVDPAAYDAATQVVTFDGLNLNSGQYFTLVTDLTNKAPGGVITNLYTWYRADKGVTTSGTNASLLADQSASAKDVAQGGAGLQPAYNTAANLINFNPNLSLDGTASQLMSNATISHAATNGEDIFAVVALPTAATGSQTIVGLGTALNSTNTTELRCNTGSIAYVVNSSSVVHTTASNGQVLLANANRTIGGTGNIVLNGTQVATGAVTPVTTHTQLNIGARRLSLANSLFYTGRVAEVAIYNRQLTTIERDKVESYFAIKYGLTLPHNYVDPAGTIVWDITANTGYGFNITGIGRDDCNGLHQKQSKSVNTNEALVTIGNGPGIAATNAANTNGLDNNIALLFGDNNGARAAWTATGAPANRERLPRTWRTQETGAIGTVTIQVPANSSASTVKLPLERDATVYLLVSNTNDFSTGATEVPMTLNGNNWEASYDFTTGDYFTFATNDLCVSAQAKLSNYNAATIAATDKCYVNGWLLFRDPVDATKYIAAIYDPAGLIDKTKISARIVANAAFPDLGKTDGVKAARLMRRLLQIDCVTCFDAVANPNPGFTVRMFYQPTEKSDAESIETNNMEQIKTANSITDPHFFKWFKAADRTATDVVSGLSPNGIHAGGQEWMDGVLATSQVDGVDYVDFAGINGFSTFGGIWLVNVNNALPVVWLDVNATANQNAITIKWSTAAERNNVSFDVERSEDETHYRSVATVAANGNSSTVSRYTVNDNQVKPGVKYYYRIRQTDIDGRVSYSKIVSATLNGGALTVKVKPNPVKQLLQLEITAARQQGLQVLLTDMSGKILSRHTLAAQSGSRTFQADVSKYSNGTYFVRVISSEGGLITEKFIIQRD